MANTVSDDVTVIDVGSHEVVLSIPAGRGAHLPVISPDGRYGYVANFASDNLTVWNCHNHHVIASIPVGIYPHFFAFSTDGDWLVVSNTGESSVCIIDARQHEMTSDCKSVQRRRTWPSARITNAHLSAARAAMKWWSST